MKHKVWNKQDDINGILAQEILQRRVDLANTENVLLFYDENTGIVTNIEIPAVLKQNLNLTTTNVNEIGDAYILYLQEQKNNLVRKTLTSNDFTDSLLVKLQGLENYVHPDNNTTRHVTDEQIQSWSNQTGFSGDYNDLTNKPNIPVVKNDLLSVSVTDALSANQGRVLNTTKASVTYVDDELNGKVDKVLGKELSSNDFTNEHKNKVDNIHTHTNKVVIDGLTEVGGALKYKGEFISTDIDLTPYDNHNANANIHVLISDKENWNSKETVSGSQEKATNALNTAKTYTDTQVAGIVNSAPETLNTLKELSTALGNDPNFATTVSNQIGTRATTVYVNTELAKKAPISHTHTKANITDFPILSAVATSGSYNDLTDLPDIANMTELNLGKYALRYNSTNDILEIVYKGV